ncbi:hypothetical protein SM124_13405 [Bacillus sp. 31A1R]|uniref:VCBS repeat-containing protein n=1 Tax=Robertmurraya mangrovi TaxID=3098077 RepID=A0ABU5IZX5_9BACI|nr:hypothetical protein [Bacillus sp. 31A1R]MDZ5472724.1 hypothetical protein [Bacillus sp. 31A1R]
MKRDLLFAFSAFFFMSLTAITGVYAVEEANKVQIISKDRLDVTGDGKKDTVFMKGVPFEQGVLFLKDIFLEIVASDGKKYKIPLEGGYEPTIQFQDLNQDNIKDLIVTVETGGSGGLSNHYLYTLKDFKVTDLTVPEPLIIQSEFLDHYKATINIQNNNKTYHFNLKSRAEDYERIGLYHNGKLNEPTELMVLPFGTLKPIPLENQMGLKGVQRISGAYNADFIAFVESTWLLENGKWVVRDVNVMEKKTKDK